MSLRNKIYKHILFALAGVLLVLISSCNVKKVIADIAGVSYSKPLNLSKTALSQTGSCHFDDLHTAKASVEKQSLNLVVPIGVQRSIFTVLNPEKKQNTRLRHKRFIFDKIPLYILYQKMKFDV
ncbi:hypothetical protein [Flavobacterium coralii]|uniref:hypothetical protein n=1 Tax=Flavobacterium coralii TaxID=2838017 RepID=UPI00267D6D1D|tara:strand:- start:16101 stop:16472 length:372 start_codon:yes stop_codon:yes gene_type:complete